MYRFFRNFCDTRAIPSFLQGLGFRGFRGSPLHRLDRGAVP